jgi:hypothetical protein
MQIRVSSVISNSPIIMNVDCDMYSNNSGSIRDALCFFLDEEQGEDIGFVQYPQNFENVVHNDIYGNPINTVNEVNTKVNLACPRFSIEDITYVSSCKMHGKPNPVFYLIELIFSWIILVWMGGVECVTMAQDASIGERLYVGEFTVKITRKIGLG